MIAEVLYNTTATSVFLSLQSNFARPYWEANITVCGVATEVCGTLGQAYGDNDIISIGEIDREKPVAISGLSRVVAGDVIFSLNNVCGTYSPNATASIFTDAQGTAHDYMNSIVNIWGGFVNTSGTAYTIQRGSFLLSKIQIDSARRMARLTCEDAAKIPLQGYVGLPDESGTATTWTPPSGVTTQAIMTELLSAVGLSASQYDLASGFAFPQYAAQEKKVSEAIAELAQANDGYVYTDGQGKIVFATNAPAFDGASLDGTLKTDTTIAKSTYVIDIKNLINKVQVKFGSGLVASRTTEDATVTKGRTQILNNASIDRASIANSLSSRLLGQFKNNKPFIELSNIWMPSLEIGNVIEFHDESVGTTQSTAVSYEIYRIREDIPSMTSKLYGVDLTYNETKGPNRQKWGFLSDEDEANCGTVFTDSWHSGFCFLCNVATGFDDDGNNDNAITTGYAASGAGTTGIELPFILY